MKQLWKLYFLLWIFVYGIELIIRVKLWNNFHYSYIFDFMVILLVTIALYSLAWNKLVLPSYVWRATIVLLLGKEIYYIISNWSTLADLASSMFISGPAYFTVPAIISFIFYNTMCYMGLVLQSFKSVNSKINDSLGKTSKRVFITIIAALFAVSANFIIRIRIEEYNHIFNYAKAIFQTQ